MWKSFYVFFGRATKYKIQLQDDLNECDAESLNDENLMLNNDKLCAAYSKDLDENIENNEHHSKAWIHVNNDLENEISLHNKQ